MARYDVTVEYNGENRTVRVQPSVIDYLRPGDIIYFNGIGIADDLRVLNYDTADWVTKDSVVGDGEYLHRRHSGEGKTDYVTIRTNGYTGSLKTVTRAKDTYPDSYNFYSQTDRNPKGLYSQTKTITGINYATRATLSSSLNAYFLVGSNQKPSTSTMVENGDSLTIYYNAPDDYDKKEFVYVDVGGREDNFSVQTRKWPIVDQVINFPHSGRISLRDVGEFFGWNGSHPNLTEYYRGGGLVPSILQNEHIPKSGKLRLSDMEGSASALYFLYRPPTKRAMRNVLSSGGTESLVWDFTNEYMVGYGATANDLEYRYTITRDDSLGNGDFTFTSRTGSPGSWHRDNTWVRVQAYGPRNRENIYSGTLTVHVRNRQDHSLAISTTVSWDIVFYGP